MNPNDVYEVFRGIGASHLHHANTVTTGCTFLEHGGLLSRGYAEKHALPQTCQSSDDIDRKYGIWDRVFVDHVDIHYRAGRKKGPNQYGPVLFILSLDVLLNLPATSAVLVAKMNPIYWNDTQTDEQRWYLTADELSKNISYGDFDKMLVIQTPDGKLDFCGRKAQIALDDPTRILSSGNAAYAHAEQRLREAAKVGRVNVAIDRHACRGDCCCVETYKGYAAKYFDSLFG
jgi:hypothetical protein